MKLVSFGPPGAEEPGVLVRPDAILPLRHSHGLPSGGRGEILSRWPSAEPLLRSAVDRYADDDLVPLADTRLGPPVPRPGTVIAIGFNYAAHGDEVLGAARPKGEPIVFLKPASSVCGPGDAIVCPPETRQLDYEVELAVVIGRGGQRIPRAEALEYVAGYMIANDVTARDIAFGAGAEHPLLFQIARAKGSPSFCPTGPWLVTPDEFDPADAGLRLWVNGELRQHGSTAGMAVGVAELIASVSRSMALRPGDLLLTGTPPGCGFQLDPPRFLADGDVVEAEIDGLGRMRSPVISEPVAVAHPPLERI
ncbi:MULTISPECIES: fumarylacetoacetate hydrolase family protein [Amycolatopsis]|uniref:Fumarylacetoacetate hydrolase family protein n=1 Tax=Amycolatopsis albidoflavus TaxID=102226 RepID=A0ABW5ID45_9PSEU